MLGVESRARLEGRDLLLRTPRTDIASFPEGSAAKVVGRVTSGRGRIVAPLSRSECAAYEVLVRGGEGAELERRTAACDFLVEDHTGRALVTAAGLLLVNHYFSLYEETGLFRKASPAAVEILRSVGIPPPSLLSGTRFGFGERRICFGDWVAVFGTGTWEADPEVDGGRSGYRANRVRLRLEGSPVLVTSDPESLG